MKSIRNDLLIDQDLLQDLLSNPLYFNIINSKPFKRLKKISFLGAIDYKKKTNKRFYRYEHSISVATLGLLYARLKKLNRKETDYLVVSALLHDIGHSPLSHSAEFGFKSKYGINHHDNGNSIINGTNCVFKNDIKNILNDCDLDENYIVALLDKDIDNDISFILNNPINIDTIDGILRSYLTLNYHNKYQKIGFIPTTTEIIKAVVNKDETILNQFWNLKHRMYNEFIHKAENLYLDNLIKEYIEESDIDEDTFYVDDNVFFNQNKSLLEKLRNIINVEKILLYNQREYFTKPILLTNLSDIEKKYKCKKYKNEKKLVAYRNDIDNYNLFEGLV